MTVGSGNLLARLTELHEAGQPTPRDVMVMEDGSPHYTAEALVAKHRGARLAWDALPAVLSLITAAQRLRDSRGFNDEETEAAQDELAAALAPFIEED